MVLLLIIADDFTGALDTGVQFAARGIRTRIVVDPEPDLENQDAQVLVADTETRHLPPSEAYCVVEKLAKRAAAARVAYLYKKTDSALRGNIGAELAAVYEAFGCSRLPFLPAFPQTGRITREGIHYVDGVPVTESPFGADPFEPVLEAAVTALISRQCPLPAKSFPPLRAGEPVPKEQGILVFDAESAEDLASTGRQLFRQGELRAMAGCAGFAAELPELLDFGKKEEVSFPKLDPRLLVVCGSVNPITLAQLDRAERDGFSRLRLTPRQKLKDNYWESGEGKEELRRVEEMLAASPHCIIETNDPGGNQLTADYARGLGLDREAMRVKIAESLGRLVGELFASPSLGTLLLTGGDTLLQCMNCLGVRELEPVWELEKGVVLARFTYKGCTRHVITKSGGFGTEGLLTDLAGRIAENVLCYIQK